MSRFETSFNCALPIGDGFYHLYCIVENVSSNKIILFCLRNMFYSARRSVYCKLYIYQLELSHRELCISKRQTVFFFSQNNRLSFHYVRCVELHDLYFPIRCLAFTRFTVVIFAYQANNYALFNGTYFLYIVYLNVLHFSNGMNVYLNPT